MTFHNAGTQNAFLQYGFSNVSPVVYSPNIVATIITFKVLYRTMKNLFMVFITWEGVTCNVIIWTAWHCHQDFLLQQPNYEQVWLWLFLPIFTSIGVFSITESLSHADVRKEQSQTTQHYSWLTQMKILVGKSSLFLFYHICRFINILPDSSTIRLPESSIGGSHQS